MLLKANETVKESKDGYYGPTENLCLVCNSGFAHLSLEANYVGIKTYVEIIVPPLLKSTNITNKLVCKNSC